MSATPSVRDIFKFRITPGRLAVAITSLRRSVRAAAICRCHHSLASKLCRSDFDSLKGNPRNNSRDEHIRAYEQADWAKICVVDGY